MLVYSNYIHTHAHTHIVQLCNDLHLFDRFTGDGMNLIGRLPTYPHILPDPLHVVSMEEGMSKDVQEAEVQCDNVLQHIVGDSIKQWEYHELNHRKDPSEQQVAPSQQQ